MELVTVKSPEQKAREWQQVLRRIKDGPIDKSSRVLTNWTAGRMSGRVRAFDSAQHNRIAGDWSALNTSADSEIMPALRTLRARSRELIRNNDYAKWAKQLIVNNVIGSGIGMQAQVRTADRKLLKSANDEIERVIAAWSDKDQCSPDGKLHWADMERLIVGSLVENGEVILRKVRKPFGKGRIPYAIQLLEADRLMDQWSAVQAPNGNQIRMGVEMDEWRRAVAYWFYPTHPGDYLFRSFDPSKWLRVPADEIIHLYLPDRIEQTRGIPWLHTAIKRVVHMGGYEDAEVVAARASAAICGFITTPDASLVPDGADVGERGQPQNVMDLEPGTFRTLAPGESFAGFNPSRPNQAMGDFMRLMLRGMAAGVGVNYSSLSKDYSQANYSSERASLLDQRDQWRVLQGWFIRQVRYEIHRDVLDAAALCGDLKLSTQAYFANRDKFQAVRFKPRGWSWIDPSKEVAAYKEAVRCGFMTVGDVIDVTSEHSDYEDNLLRRADELQMEKDAGVVWDTNPNAVDSKGKEQGAPASDGELKPADEAKPADGEGGDE
jgi:lambda family phage portal protein